MAYQTETTHYRANNVAALVPLTALQWCPPGLRRIYTKQSRTKATLPQLTTDSPRGQFRRLAGGEMTTRRRQRPLYVIHPALRYAVIVMVDI